MIYSITVVVYLDPCRPTSVYTHDRKTISPLRSDYARVTSVARSSYHRLHYVVRRSALFLQLKEVVGREVVLRPQPSDRPVVLSHARVSL